MTGDGWNDGSVGDVRDQTDVLAGGRSVRDELRDRWAGTPRWGRAVRAVTLLLAGIVVVVFAAFQARGWLLERGLRNQVSLVGTVSVWSVSTTPAGGTVDYSLLVRNAGRRPVQITAVDITQSRLHVTDRSQHPVRLAPGETAAVPVSVRLDCTAGGVFGPRDALRGTVVALPLSGRQRRVKVTFQRSSPLTDVANTVCAVRPDLTDKELSGPIFER